MEQGEAGNGGTDGGAVAQVGRNLYRCYYNGRSHDVVAGSSYQAQETAARLFRVKGYKVATTLVGKGYNADTGTVAELVPVNTGAL